MRYPDFCPTCEGVYVRGEFTVCSDAFHLCRECQWFLGQSIKQCIPCELARTNDVLNRAVDLLTYIARRDKIDLAALYNDETRNFTSIKILLERCAKRRAEVGEWDSH